MTVNTTFTQDLHLCANIMGVIARTSWGNILGKAKDSTCFYPYNGKEYSTDEFYWLVKGTSE